MPSRKKKKPVIKEKPKEELTKVEKAQGIFKIHNPDSNLADAKQYNNALDAYVREMIDPILAGNRYLDGVKDAYVQRINELTDVKRLDKLALDEKNESVKIVDFNRLKNNLGISLRDIREPMTGKVVAEGLAIDKGKVQEAINHINDNILKKEVKEKPKVEDEELLDIPTFLRKQKEKVVEEKPVEKVPVEKTKDEKLL